MFLEMVAKVSKTGENFGANATFIALAG